MEIGQILKAIRPHVLEWIADREAQTIGAHNLSGLMHSGTLADDQAPQFLKLDGSRALVGNLTVMDGITIDGVDISVLGGSVTGHLAATAAAGHGSVGAHNHQTTANGGQLDHGAALSGLGDDDHTQYLNNTRHDTTTRHTLGTVVPHDDHGNLSGLGDDDHTQYLNTTRHNDTAHATINHHAMAGLGDDDHAQYLLVNGTRSMTGNLLPNGSDTFDLGSSTKIWRKGYLSEINALVFAEQTIALVGGWLMICKDQGVLAADAGAAATQMDFGKAMTANDIVLFRDVSKVEYIRVGALVSGTTYNVVRNLDGSGANDWVKGSVFATLGGKGDGRIELNAYDTPRISMFQYPRTYVGDMPYNADKELIRLGDLNGNWGYSSAKYGIAIGVYNAGKANIVIDEDGVMRFRNYATSVIEFSGSDANITGVLRMPGTGSALAIGSTPPTGSAAGTGIWIDRTGLYSLSSGTYQVKIDAATGKMYAGSGNVILDNDGIAIVSGGNSANQALRLLKPSTGDLLAMMYADSTIVDVRSYFACNWDYSAWSTLLTNGYMTIGAYSNGGRSRVALSALEITTGGDWNGVNLYVQDGSADIKRVNVDGAGLYIGDVLDYAGSVAEGHLRMSGGILGTDVTQAPFNGWLDMSHQTWTRLSNTTFRVSGDQTAIFTRGTKIRVTQTSTKYFYVVSSSYASPNTTVTITGGSDYSLTASPSARWISYQANPQGFPQWFNYAPTWGGFSSAPTVANAVFTITGRMVTVVVNCSGNGTSNATTLTCTLPIAAAYAGRGAAGYAVNNGSVLTVAGRIYVAAVAAASNTMYAYTDMGTGAWTNSGAKRLDFCLTYGI